MAFNKLKICYILPILFFVLPLAVCANETRFLLNHNVIYGYQRIQKEIEYNYSNVPTKEWEKYFNNQAKIIRKEWKKEKTLLNDDKYKTAYVRVLFFVNNKGDILSYQIKSSCIPKGDKKFIEAVGRTISNIPKLKDTPQSFKHDTIVYTVKISSYLPKFRSTQYVDWNRYGVADVEVASNTSYVLLLRK